MCRENIDVAPIVPADHPAINGVRAWAIDPALTERLWQLSERSTGVRFEACGGPSAGVGALRPPCRLPVDE